MDSNGTVAYALPDIGDREIEAVVDVLRTGWITTGPKTKEFEKAFARAVGASHAVMLNSCTAALHLALEAVGVRPGDEVIVPTVTFAATAEVVHYLGARPVLVDVNSETHNVSIEAIERAITPRSRAILPVHFGGCPCDMDEIMALGRAHGLSVIDDAAHCFPCRYKGRLVGTLADITAFSFYATKTITTGEGGAAVTENEEWADRMRVMSLHGISRDAWKRYAADGNWYYEILAPGYKYNLTDIASAIGLVQLSRAEAMLARRRQIASAYNDAFCGIDELELIPTPKDRESAHHLFVLKLRPERLSIDRNRFIEELRRLGVGTSVHFIPLHLHPYYRSTFGYRPEACPVATDLYVRSLSLPIYSRMSDQEVERVIDAVLQIVRAHKA